MIHASGHIGIEIAQDVVDRVRRPDVLPTYPGGQSYSARNTPGILNEGGVPLLPLILVKIAIGDIRGNYGTCQKIFECGKGNVAIVVPEYVVVEDDEDLLVAEFNGVVAENMS